MSIAEVNEIKKGINELSIEEFERILYDCGIESIKPSIESEYVKCLKNVLAEGDYRKLITKYDVKEEYFNVDMFEQEVA